MTKLTWHDSITFSPSVLWKRSGLNTKLIFEPLFQDEKDGLLKFTEEALGIEDEDSRIQLNEKLNSTLDKMR